MTIDGPERTERRLAAILAADVVGFSRLMSANEEGTHIAVKAVWHQVTDPTIEGHRGRVVKTMGDGLLVEFASVLDAVRCAVDIQCEMISRNASQPVESRIEFRIGINIGDIIIDGADIIGDGVNIAARLESLAPANGICVSRIVRDQVRDKLALRFADIGHQQVKNIARPVHVFRILLGDAPPPIKGSNPAAGAAKAPAFDKALLGLCEILALMLALPFGEDLYNGRQVPVSHWVYLGSGLLFAAAGPLWPQVQARASLRFPKIRRTRFHLGLVPTAGLAAFALLIVFKISAGPNASPSGASITGAERDAISFEKNVVVLPTSADEALRRQSTYLHSHPSATVTVKAYCADDEDSRTDRKVLAELRANQVRDALKKRKISGDRIKVDVACEAAQATPVSDDAASASHRPRVDMIPN